MKEKISRLAGEVKKTAPAGALKLKGTFDLIGEVFRVFKKEWKTLVMLQVIPVALTLVISFLGSLMEASGEEVSPVILILFFLLLLPMVFFSLWGTFSLMLAVVKGTANKDWKEFYRESIKIFWGISGLAILVGLAVLGGLLLLIVPGLLFSVWFGFALWIYIEKGKGSGLIKAMSESKRVVKGFFWSIVWRQMVFSFLLGLVMMPVVFILMALGAAFAFLPGMNSAMAEFLANLFQTPVQMVATPISFIFVYLLYCNARELKDRGVLKQKLPVWVKVVVPVVILVMVVVPASLAVVAVKVLGGAREKARDNNRIDDLKKVEWALEIYKVQSGSYPDSLVELEELLDLDEEATDPLTGEEYEYRVLNEGEAFEICAKMQGREFKEPYCVNSQ